MSYTIPIFGFVNNSAVCYLNSLLQCLISNETLNKEIISFEQREPTNGFDTYKHLITSLSQQLPRNPERIQNVNHRGFLSTFVENSKNFQLCRPEDADEFLTIFLDSLHEELIKESKMKNSIISDLFHVTILSKFICKKCKYLQNKKEIQSNLYVTPPENSQYYTETIENCIKNIIKSEILTDYKCEKCNSISTTVKETTIENIPPCLNIVFSRIMAPQLQLDCLERISIRKGNTKLIYKLTGAVFHIGSNRGGHYFAICKRGDDWYRCDDTNIHKYPKFDRRLFHYAYIIFYILESSSSSD